MVVDDEDSLLGDRGSGARLHLPASGHERAFVQPLEQAGSLSPSFDCVAPGGSSRRRHERAATGRRWKVRSVTEVPQRPEPTPGAGS